MTSARSILSIRSGLRAAAYPILLPEDYVWTTLGTFLALMGPSGSGKSSLVRAGVVAAIQAGAVPGSGVPDSQTVSI